MAHVSTASLTSISLADNNLCGLDALGCGTYDATGINAIADALRVNDRADKRQTPSSDEELKALLAAHGLLDGGLALVAEIVPADVELCRQQHALTGIQSKKSGAARTLVSEAMTRMYSARILASSTPRLQLAMPMDCMFLPFIACRMRRADG